MDSPTSSQPIRGFQVNRTPQGSFVLGTEDVLLERSGSGRLHLRQPGNLEVVENVEMEFIEAPQPRLTPRRLFGDETDPDTNVHDDILDAPLAEALAVDSGSEVEEDVEQLTADQLLNILQDPEDEDDETLNLGNYEWSAEYTTFTGNREPFTEEVGPKIEGTSPIEIFTQLWDQPLMEMVRDQTNLYAWQYIVPAVEAGLPAQSRVHDWVETSISELYKLFAMIILMGICVRGTLDEYWFAGVLGMPGFRTIMSKNRFMLLMRFMHFRDNNEISGTGNERKCAKIIPILDYLNNKFRAVYSPRRDLSIDESLLLWKGRLSWVQCIRTKAARFGIKSYELCEAVTGYVLNLIIYTGKGTLPKEPTMGFTNSTAVIVLTLLGQYLGKGYTLFMDNFYNSVDLCRFLKQRATDVVGTLNRRRRNTPAEIQQLNERRMARGSVESRHCGDISVTAWKDVKLVTTVSTYHDNSLVMGRRAGQQMMKPAVVEDYNKFMGGVDLKDQKLSGYLLERKRGLKWYIKVFRRLLNISILNSYIIFKANTNSTLTHRQFRYKLAEQLVEKYGTPPAAPRQCYTAPVTCDRLNRELDHNPEQAETDGERTSARQHKLKRARCVRCLALKQRKMTNVFCKSCKVYLCLGKCYHDYHNLRVL